MTSTNSARNFVFDNHWWYQKESLLFVKGVQKEKLDMQSLDKNPTRRRCKFWVNFK